MKPYKVLPLAEELQMSIATEGGKVILLQGQGL